jgi:formamidopyrimidine-DNA glycosylase
MPELPEVEAMARAVRPLIEGRRILRCRVIHPVAARPSSWSRARAAFRTLERNATGQTIRRVERRGKYLLVQLDRGCLAFHFRLDGKLIWFTSAEPAGHVDVALRFARGTLGFVDPRHLGRVAWAPSREEIPGIARLGLEPLAPAFSAERLEALLRRSRQPLKLWLMDQRHIAGLGNIYSSEALWRARLNPQRRACRVRPEEARRLHQGIVAVLRAALECTVDPAPDLANPDWWFAGLARLLRVYGRKGEPCRRCGRLIRRIAQAGRGSYYCPGCQR